MTDAEIIEREMRCVERNDGVNCDRDCAKCDLVLDVKDILRAYRHALALLRIEEAFEKAHGLFADAPWTDDVELCVTRGHRKQFFIRKKVK